MTTNPKLAGSNVIDCIPQVGECPNHCSECFYNGGRFYRTLDEPLLPTLDEAKGKIVRVNSGNDSNNKRGLVIRATEKYMDKFYNTCIPNLDFPGPVVLTINPQASDQMTLLDVPPANLMFVRVRVGLWDHEIAKKAVEWYGPKGVPVLMTFMRYYNGDLIPKEYKDEYEWKKHIQNSYYLPQPAMIVAFMARLAGTGARMCGTPWSAYCADCGHCEEFYNATWRRMSHAVLHREVTYGC